MHSSYLFVGLGNPGEKYEATRHNFGFMVIDELARVHNGQQISKNRKYILLQIQIAEHDILLAKPLTYMNRSGIVVKEVVEKFNFPLKKLLVIVDDFNLPFGKLRLRSKGSDGGHNGLLSIIYELGSRSFPRLRVGIGIDDKVDPARFVLSNFKKKERIELPNLIERSAEACISFVTQGLNKTMNQFN